jgi:hypothetical protein
MKHSLLFLALLAVGTGAARAQTTTVSPLEPTSPLADTTARPLRLAVGLTAGATYTSFGGSDATSGHDSRYKWGYHAGLTADIGLTEKVSFHPEVLYTLKGADFAVEASNRDLTYLDVPLLVRYHTSPLVKTSTLFLEAGPQVSTLLTAKTEAKANAKSEFNNVNLDFVLGAGYRWANGLVLGLRYDIGITNVYRKVPSAASMGRGDYQQNATTDAFLLLVGYSFSH